MVSQNKLCKLIKIYNKEINSMKIFIELFKTQPINNKPVKWKKHAPLSEYNDTIEYILTDNDKILIKFERNQKIGQYTTYNNSDYNGKEPHSFSFSEKSLNDHKIYIIDKIKEYINSMELIYDELCRKHKNNMHHLVPEYDSSNINIKIKKDYKKEFKKTCNIDYEKIYILGLRPQAFIQIKGKKLQVATSYIIAFNNNKWNIFFDINYDLFNNHDSTVIQKFNEDESRKITLENLLDIIDRLNNHISPLNENFDILMNDIGLFENRIIKNFTVTCQNKVINSGYKEPLTNKLDNIKYL
jgi:hypothetical protein